MGRQIACLLMFAMPKNDNDDSLHIPKDFAFSICDPQLAVCSVMFNAPNATKAGVYFVDQLFCEIDNRHFGTLKRMMLLME